MRAVVAEANPSPVQSRRVDPRPNSHTRSRLLPQLETRFYKLFPLENPFLWVLFFTLAQLRGAGVGHVAAIPSIMLKPLNPGDADDPPKMHWQTKADHQSPLFI